MKSTDIIIGILYIICILNSYLGYTIYFNQTGRDPGFWSKLYFCLQLFVFNNQFNADPIPVLLNIGRFFSPFLLAGTIVKLFFSTLIVKLNELYIRYRVHGHLVFCGLGTKSYLLIKDYLSKISDLQVVVIEQNRENQYINEIRNNRVRFILGCADDPVILEKANIYTASTIFALTDIDKTNIGIVHKVVELFENKKINKPVKIILHISDHFNMNIFKEFQERNFNNIDFHAFNIYQKIASVVVNKNCPDQFASYSSTDDPRCHILIHGANKLGDELIKESIQLYHFANTSKIRITVVDHVISEKAAEFSLKYPSLDYIAEVEFITSDELFVNDTYRDLADISLCYITGETESQSFEIAKRYRQLFVKNKIKLLNIADEKGIQDKSLLIYPRIVILMPRDPDILSLFKNTSAVSDYLRLDRFSFYEHVCKKEIIADDLNMIDNIAMQIHNIYRGLKEAELMRSWEKLTDREKDFNRYPARHLAVKLRYLKALLVSADQAGEEFDLGNITAHERFILAKMEHNRWIAEKLLAGYVPFEEIENPDLQSKLKSHLSLHKDIKLWDELSEADRNKDSMLIDNIHTIISSIDKKLIVKSEMPG